MTDDMLLDVQDVSKTYHTGGGDLEVLKNITFAVDYGEVVALMGPSGVGKTTLLNLIGALDSPSGGEIYLQGQHLNTASASDLAIIRNRHIGFVFQFHHLLPEFSALENVFIPALIHQERSIKQRERAVQLLERFGLVRRLDHHPHELSGGEKQRVALARALMNQPALVLADEPTGNLDRRTGENLLAAILKFSREQRQTFLIATHDETIGEKADRVLHLENGVISVMDDTSDKW